MNHESLTTFLIGNCGKELSLPELYGVSIAGYLSWYKQMTVMLIHDKEPIVDPLVEIVENTVVVPPVQFEQHGN